MIAASQEVIDEISIVGGTAALVQVSLWSPNQREEELKFKIICADYNGGLMDDWEFSSKTEATEAFEDLTQRAA